MVHAMVSVATGVLSPVLRKLATLLENKYSSLKSVRDEILALQDELGSMTALLLKLADMDDLDIQVKEWRNQIRELSYEIEDCIDDFIRRVHRDPTDKSENIKGFFQESIHKLRTLGARSDIASKISKIKARVDHASDRRKRYNFDGAISSSSKVTPVDPRLPALYADTESLVGIDEAREEIIECLNLGATNSVGKLKVVSIVGLGGLGKTTLARQVYDKIEGEFDCRAFVSVSQKPDLKKIFRNILTAVTGIGHYAGIEACDEEQLINKLREFLKEKRSCCCPDYHNVCEMKPLSDANAEKLFFKRIFGPEDQCPSHLKEVSSDILRKCGGLPLAIISIASLLANKPCIKEQWERYRNSIGLTLEQVPSVSNMQRILSLSYNDLPHYLKTCLLYLSTFPEDFIIERDQLVRRWIAEGFVCTNGGHNLEEVGECYFDDLINRGMIMPVRRFQFGGRVDCCRVHDVILDLIVSKSIEENFITLLGNHNNMQGAQDNARRLSLDCRDQDNIIVPPTMVLSKARSFPIYGATEHMPLLSDFEALRVIHIEGNDRFENHHLNDIGRLFQLKYLRLEKVSISKLPEQIGELQQLETLEVVGTRIKELPKNIVRLKKLMFIFCQGVSLFEGISNMKALQELRYVKVEKSVPTTSLDELGSLTELRYLGLDWCVRDTSADKKSYTDSFVSCISRLCSFKLRHLDLLCDVKNDCSLDFLLDSWSPPPYLLQKFEMDTAYSFPRVPGWVTSLSNVTFLDININPLGKDVLRVLGGLHSLLVLWLWTQEVGPKEKLTICSSGFQSLKQFELYTWNVAMGPLVFEVGAMPKLEKFILGLIARGAGALCAEFCRSLQHNPSLKHLLVEIDCTGARAKEVETTEATIRNATHLISKHIRIGVKRIWADQVVKDEDEGSIEGNGSGKEYCETSGRAGR